jgi:starch phosphorylase
MQPAILKPFSYENFPSSGHVAYFSMEIAIHPSMPTYSGGLGVLAGDTLRSAADLGIPLVAFTLLHRKGYFQQHLDRTGFQTEEVQPWTPEASCIEEAARVTVSVEDRVVNVRAWRYDMKGRSGHVVPIYLLDTDVDGNSGWDRGLTDHLYGGDTNYRLQQEIVLGMGGSRMAHALGYRVNVYHMKGRWAADRLEPPPKPTSKWCAASASSPPTRRFRPATTASPPSSPFAFWAATARRALKSRAVFATAC